MVLARAVLPILDEFQSRPGKRQEIALEHGKAISKQWDEVMFIQATKAALSANSAFYSANELNGHLGGTIETLAASGDATEPYKLFAAIARLLSAMELKDVMPTEDDCIVACKPDVYYTLLQAEQLINTNYITALGNSVNGMVLKTYGIPVVRSNSYPAGSNISGHPLSNAGNSNAYDGDFSKLVLGVFSPRALVAGETIPLTTAVWWDERYKDHKVDAHLSYGATIGRTELSGAIYKP